MGRARHYVHLSKSIGSVNPSFRGTKEATMRCIQTAIVMILAASAMGCKGGQGGGGGGGPVEGLIGYPTEYAGLMNGAATAVVGVIDSIETQPRSGPGYTVSIGGQPATEIRDHYRGFLQNPTVVLAAAFCVEGVLQAGDLDYRWISQTGEYHPRYVRAGGAPVPADQVPPSYMLKRRPEQTLIPGERAVFFSGCPSRRHCASNDCPNYLRWKLPLLEGDMVDLSGLKSAQGTPGPARIPLRDALELIANEWNIGAEANQPSVVARVLLPAAGTPSTGAQ